jgi:hypothetical protein
MPRAERSSPTSISGSDVKAEIGVLLPLNHLASHSWHFI